jgi:hypothetical protein
MSADHQAATEWAAHQQKHQECEDSWYSCPLSEEGSADDRSEECNCYATEINNLKAAYLEARQVLRHCYGKLQPPQPLDDWVREIEG